MPTHPPGPAAQVATGADTGLDRNWRKPSRTGSKPTGYPSDGQDQHRLRFDHAEVDAALRTFDLPGMRFAPAEIRPPMTLPGVSRLAMPSLMSEIEALAAA